MDIVTIIFLVIVAFFVWRGYQKGFIGSITRVLSWLLAYPAAIIFTKPLATLFIQHTALDGVIVYFIAGASIFLAVSFFVTLVLNGLSRLIPENTFTETGSKIGGASVGIIIGGLVGLLAVYGIILVKKPDAVPADIATASLQEQSTNLTHVAPNNVTPDNITANTTTNTTSTTASIKVPKLNELTSANDSFIEASAKKLISTAAATAVDVALDDKTATQVTKAFTQDPQSMLGHVQHVANNGKMKALLADEHIQSLLTTGDVHALMNEAGFRELMGDEHMQALVATADDSTTGATGQQAAAEKMVAAWQRANNLKHDPRIIAIISDPEFQRQLNSPNKLALMMNPKLNQLTEIIFSNETLAANGMGNYEVSNLDEPASDQSQNATAPSENKKPPTKIYRWTDADGKVHYSDQEIKK